MAWSPSSKRRIRLPARPRGSRRGSIPDATSAALTIGLLLGGLFAGLATASRAGAGPQPDQGLALVANPSRGFAPLLVDFALTLPNGSFPALAWSFGDGTYLNGSNAADLAPVHEYDRPGTFNASVTATYPAGPLIAATAIYVFGSNLSANATATPSGGTAPLSVTLLGTPEGGSGTFIVEAWDLGDGGRGNGTRLLYTYLNPGVYTAVFTVADSAGHWANATVSVNVTDRPPPPINTTNATTNVTSPDGPSLTGPVALALLTVSGVAVVAVLLWVRLSRREFAPRPTEVATPVPPPVAVEPRAAAESADSPNAPPPLPSASPGGATTIALRLVRHLAGLPREGPGDLPSPARTQAGIAEALGVGQSGVSKILRRLEAAGTVEGESGPVAGSSRRVRIYRLTGRGERLGRALQDDPLTGRAGQGPKG